MTIEQIMNPIFLTMIAQHLNEDGFEAAHNYLIKEANQTAIRQYVTMNYKGLEVWEDLEDLEEADWERMAYLEMGIAFGRIFDTLMKEYDPLENYFTNRHETENGNRRINSTEENTTTPSGSVKNTATGSVDHTYENTTSINQGTTYDAYGDNDFKNISKNKQTGGTKDTYNNYANTTTYEGDYHVTENKEGEKTEGTGRDLTETRAGASGIFSKQVLTKQEIELRLGHRIIPIFCRMVVDVFNTGVYSSDG